MITCSGMYVVSLCDGPQDGGRRDRTRADGSRKRASGTLRASAGRTRTWRGAATQRPFGQVSPADAHRARAAPCDGNPHHPGRRPELPRVGRAHRRRSRQRPPRSTASRRETGKPRRARSARPFRRRSPWSTSVSASSNRDATRRSSPTSLPPTTNTGRVALAAIAHARLALFDAEPETAESWAWLRTPARIQDRLLVSTRNGPARTRSRLGGRRSQRGRTHCVSRSAPVVSDERRPTARRLHTRAESPDSLSCQAQRAQMVRHDRPRTMPGGAAAVVSIRLADNPQASAEDRSQLPGRSPVLASNHKMRVFVRRGGGTPWREGPSFSARRERERSTGLEHCECMQCSYGSGNPQNKGDQQRHPLPPSLSNGGQREGLLSLAARFVRGCQLFFDPLCNLHQRRDLLVQSLPR